MRSYIRSSKVLSAGGDDEFVAAAVGLFGDADDEVDVDADKKDAPVPSVGSTIDAIVSCRCFLVSGGNAIYFTVASLTTPTIGARGEAINLAPAEISCAKFPSGVLGDESVRVLNFQSCHATYKSRGEAFPVYCDAVVVDH